MIRLLQQLLEPSYLYAINPGPLGRWGVVYILWLLFFALGGGTALWWHRRSRSTSAAITASACGAGLVFLGIRLVAPLLSNQQGAVQVRFLLLDAWTARVWPISATLVAVLTPAFHGLSRLSLPLILKRHIMAISQALAPEDPPLPHWQTAVLGGIHLAGLAWLWSTAGHPLWWALPSLLVLSVLPLVALPRRVRMETLAPLVPAYLGSIVCMWIARDLQVDLREYQAFALPDPWSPWFNVPVLVCAGIALTIASQVRVIAQKCRPTVRTKVLPATLGICVALWMVGTVAVHRTRGVTASDPYCYVQMTVDLSKSGSPLHDFPLAGLARELALPTWPTVHIGYHPPFFGDLSPTMWPIGWSLLMVPSYWLGGLDLLYLMAPLMAACALVATWLMANEALLGRSLPTRWTVAALACILVATSPEGSERMLVPMSDAAAQCFTILTLWLLLRAQRERPILHSVWAGLTFGVAYFCRHPQLPLSAAALALSIVMRPNQRFRTSRHRLSVLAAFGLAAFITVIPDFVYRRAVFGGWLNTESTEWFLLSARNIGGSLVSILRQGLLRRDELGFLAPFAGYGGWLLWRKHNRTALILAAGFAAVFVFHLFYEALRPRDLIAILPVLYLCAAYGFVAIWRRAKQPRTIASAVLLVCCATFLFARSTRALSMPWRTDVATFGHISADEYASLLSLRDLTPEEAIIGSMLNGGAIELHAQRAAIHPAPWTEQQLYSWTDELLDQDRPFYVLDDGEEMPPVLSLLQSHYLLRPVQQLNLPYFALGGGNIPHPVWLYKVEPLGQEN